MQSVVTNQTKAVSTNNSTVGTFMLNFVINPIKSGLIAFAAFFLLLVLTELVSYFVGISEIIEVSIIDVLISLTGFGLIFTAKFLENFKGK